MSKYIKYTGYIIGVILGLLIGYLLRIDGPYLGEYVICGPVAMQSGEQLLHGELIKTGDGYAVWKFDEYLLPVDRRSCTLLR